jgi:hypothetical protein
VLRHFFKRLAPILALIFSFVGGAWVLLVTVRFLFARWLPDWVVETIFLIAFTWIVAGVIKFPIWFYDREI